MRLPKLITATALALATLGLAAWAGIRIAPESAPVARGAAYAETRGCVNCHGDPGNARIDANDPGCFDTNTIPEHPDFAASCTDVLAYFEAVRLRRIFSKNPSGEDLTPLAAGDQLARKYHCFQCHGYLGQGGFKNANSFKGYVPGFFGADFRQLTNNSDPNSVRQWILHGVDAAILDEPITGRIANYFFNQQAVHMPSFKSLPADEVEILISYVISLQQIGPMTANDVRTYGDRITMTTPLTQSN
jgi:mono/diheme cytochrome c family protein